MITDLFGNKELIAMERMRMFEPPEGYWLAFSGGKDSVVLLDLARRSGVKFEAHYNVTSVDPPELMRFIRKEHPDVIWDRPEMTMFQMIEKTGLPTRINRCCCRILKERGGEGRRMLTGIRWAESVRRKSRRPHGEEVKAGDGAAWVEHCRYGKGTTFVHPIIDWSDKEVWAYIHARNVPYCSLYDEGIKRIGCVMCPMGGTKKMRHDAARWPLIAKSYRRAIQKLYAARGDRESFARWTDADDMFDWWLEQGRWAKNTAELC